MIAAVAFEAVSIVFSEVADVTVHIDDGAGFVFNDEFPVLIPVFAAAIGGVALLVIAPQTMLYDDLFA